MLKSLAENYQLGSLVETTLEYDLYSGVQTMAGSISRPVMLKLYKSLNPQKQEQRDELLGRVRLLLEFEKHPSMKSVYDFGIDEKLGAWVATEAIKGTLAEQILPAPAAPEIVRQVMSQMLSGLMVLHERSPAIFYRSITPDNIQQLAGGDWVLNESGLERGGGAQTTLSELQIKYTAPEVLDVEKGDTVAASDLYALGMALYELALGRELFQQQFPAVYARSGNKANSGSSEDEKWLYWHVSPQLTLKPLKEIIPEFPQDLSDNIEKMLYKPLDKRASSARALYEKMAWHDVVKSIEFNKTVKKEEPAITPLAKVLLIVIVLAALAGVGVFGLSNLSSSPKIDMFETKYESENGFVRITGSVKDMPADSKLVLSARRNLIVNIVRAEVDSHSGMFSTQIPVPDVGAYSGFCGVVDKNEVVLANAVFEIVRKPPGSVAVHFITSPLAFGADITVNFLRPQSGNENEQTDIVRMVKTDLKGMATVQIPYGDYSIVVDHPRYVVYRKIFSTGSNSSAKQELKLVALSEQAIEGKRKALMQEYQRLEKLAKEGDPNAIAKMAQIQKELAQLAPVPQGPLTEKQKEEQAKKDKLLHELNTLVGADNQDPEAAAKLAKVNEELAKLNGQTTQPDYVALAKERERLEKLAASGDPAAIAALKKFDEKLRSEGIDPQKLQEMAKQQQAEEEKEAKALAAQTGNSAGGNQTQAGVGEGADNALPAGGAENAKVAAAVESALASTPVMKELDRQIEALKARAAAGDPEAIKALAELQRKKEILQALAEGKITPEEARELLNNPHALEQLDKERLLTMSLGALKQYIGDFLPSDSFTITEDTVFDKLVVEGSVLDQQGRELILSRLKPVEKRLTMNIRIDPNVIVDALLSALRECGIDQALVHPFLIGPTHRLFIGLPAAAAESQPQAAKLLAEKFVIPAQLINVRRLPPQPPEQVRLEVLKEGAE